jgi:hypothetical protein
MMNRATVNSDIAPDVRKSPSKKDALGQALLKQTAGLVLQGKVKPPKIPVQAEIAVRTKAAQRMPKR